MMFIRVFCMYLSLGFHLQILLILQKKKLTYYLYYRYTLLITVKITVFDVVFGFIVSVIGETWTFRLQSLCFDLGLEKRRRKASSNSSRPKQTKLQNPTVAIRKYRICRYPIYVYMANYNSSALIS